MPIQGVDTIVDLLDTPGIVAVGEAGLDYYYDHSPREVQQRVFAEQIQLANDHGLALVIHSRDAWDDTFAVLADAGVPERTVFHCFTGGPDEARRALDIGATLSFSGIVTFKGAPEVQAAAAICPLDRLLVETDSPYLAPIPHRGQPNRPAWVPHVGQFIADLRDVPVADVARATTDNARCSSRSPERPATWTPTTQPMVDHSPWSAVSGSPITASRGTITAPHPDGCAGVPARRIDEQPWHSPHPTDAASCWRVR